MKVALQGKGLPVEEAERKDGHPVRLEAGEDELPEKGVAAREEGLPAKLAVGEDGLPAAVAAVRVEEPREEPREEEAGEKGD